MLNINPYPIFSDEAAPWADKWIVKQGERKLKELLNKERGIESFLSVRNMVDRTKLFNIENLRIRKHSKGKIQIIKNIN